MHKSKLDDLIALNSKLDPFYEMVDSSRMIQNFASELAEITEEYEKGDYEELTKELGDVYWDFLVLMDKLEDEGKIQKDQVYESIYRKMSGRKSFLLENRKPTHEEAKKIWNDAKRAEGYEESRLWDGTV
ncbi:MAG: MazG nucleotide pyrophosphohydrolase domain-containing protein [Candidatus Gracilibacteria bacterium]|nr:MazG nucleotide pyrophosphohydrolase domain-containing protein [Candidatus Gracilibacteria bacterium]